MDEEKVMEIIKHIDRYKDAGDEYTRDDVIAISKLVELYRQKQFKIVQLENDLDYIKKSIAEICNNI